MTKHFELLMCEKNWYFLVLGIACDYDHQKHKTEIYFSKFCSNISGAGFCYFVVCYFSSGDRVNNELVTDVDLNDAVNYYEFHGDVCHNDLLEVGESVDDLDYSDDDCDDDVIAVDLVSAAVILHIHQQQLWWRDFLHQLLVGENLLICLITSNFSWNMSVCVSSPVMHNAHAASYHYWLNTSQHSTIIWIIGFIVIKQMAS